MVRGGRDPGRSLYLPPPRPASGCWISLVLGPLGLIAGQWLLLAQARGRSIPEYLCRRVSWPAELTLPWKILVHK